VDARVFAVERRHPEGGSVVSLTNVTGQTIAVPYDDGTWDLLDNTRWDGTVRLEPYGVRWLTNRPPA
jgi:hypothetical protein